MIISNKPQLQQQVLYTAIGRLPKIAGSYLTNINKEKQVKSLGQIHQKKKREGRGLNMEMAKERLNYQIKRGALESASRRLKGLLGGGKCQTEGNERIMSERRYKNQVRNSKLRAQWIKNKRYKQHQFKQQQFSVNLGDNLENFTSQYPQISATLPENHHLDDSTSPRKHRIKLNDFDINQLEQQQQQSRLKFRTEQNESEVRMRMSSERVDRGRTYEQRSQIIDKIRQKHLQNIDQKGEMASFSRWNHLEPVSFKRLTKMKNVQK